jgi:hypothetical protein
LSSRYDETRCEHCGVCLRDTGRYAQAGGYLALVVEQTLKRNIFEPALYEIHALVSKLRHQLLGRQLGVPENSSVRS